MTREELLTRALEQILHSVGQARKPGNDVKRELTLIENTVTEALTYNPGAYITNT